MLHIFFSLRVQASVSIGIYNVAGEPVRRIQIEGHPGDNVVPWPGVNDVGGRCSSGIYLLQVVAKGVDGTQAQFWDRAAAAR
jgi:hypothetical protein